LVKAVFFKERKKSNKTEKDNKTKKTNKQITEKHKYPDREQ
jgi:hypothetical protein